MARKAAPKTTEELPEEAPQRGTSFFDYLRFGESYTSLILGIIVVIISTALLLSFVHNRNAGTVNAPGPNQTNTVAQVTQQAFQISSVPSLSPLPTAEGGEQPTATPKPTAKPTVKPTSRPTTVPTVKPTEVAKKATVAPTKKVEPTAAPKKEEPVKEGQYVVKAGDNLWNIAERHYKSGYNWVDIARANKLSNPGQITAGTKLNLPKVTAKTPTTMANDQKNTTQVGPKISGDSYKIAKGDNLWNIAVRAYGDGYKWVDIARANKLTNPGLIHVNNTLKLPRGK